MTLPLVPTDLTRCRKGALQLGAPSDRQTAMPIHRKIAPSPRHSHSLPQKTDPKQGTAGGSAIPNLKKQRPHPQQIANSRVPHRI